MITNFLQNIFNTGHHAVAIVGDPLELLPAVEDCLNSLNIGLADRWCEVFDNLHIDTSREIKNWQTTKPMAGETKYGVFGIGTANNEAQNTLLKVLEEPTVGVRFVLLINSTGILLPTVLSRLEVFNFEPKIHESEKAKEFLSAEPVNRLALLEEMFDYKKDEQVRLKVIKFLSECERVVQSQISAGGTPPAGFSVLSRALRQLSDRSAVPRLIMDHVATTLPIVRN